MNRKPLLAFLLSFLVLGCCVRSLPAQPVDCKEDVEFIVQTFRQNYAGFPTLQSRHGQKDLNAFLTALKEQAGNRETIDSCEKSIREFVDFTGNGHVNWGRHKKFQEQSESDKADISKQVDKNPSFKTLNNRAVLLTIPGFSISFKDSIDKLVQTHHERIISSELLIIDVRGNGGGSDASYKKLIPYFYTGPIVQYSAEFLASSDNISYFQKLYDSGKLPDDVKQLLGKLLGKM